MTRSDRFQAARAQAVEAFLGVVNPETRPTFCATEAEALEVEPVSDVQLLDAVVDDGEDTIPDLAGPDFGFFYEVAP